MANGEPLYLHEKLSRRKVKIWKTKHLRNIYWPAIFNLTPVVSLKKANWRYLKNFRNIFDKVVLQNFVAPMARLCFFFVSWFKPKIIHLLESVLWTLPIRIFLKSVRYRYKVFRKSKYCITTIFTKDICRFWTCVLNVWKSEKFSTHLHLK